MRVWTTAFTFFSFLSIIFFPTPGILYMWGWINVCSGQCIERTKGQIVQFYLISCAAPCTCCVFFIEGLNRGNQSKDFPFKDLLDIIKTTQIVWDSSNTKCFRAKSLLSIDRILIGMMNVLLCLFIKQYDKVFPLKLLLTEKFSLHKSIYRCLKLTIFSWVFTSEGAKS